MSYKSNLWKQLCKIHIISSLNVWKDSPWTITQVPEVLSVFFFFFWSIFQSGWILIFCPELTYSCFCHLHSWSPHGRLFKFIFFSSIISFGSFYCWHLFADFALLGGGIFLSSSRAAPAPPSPGLWPPQTFPDASCVAVRHPSFQTEKFQTENNIFPQIHYVLFCISLDEAVHLFGIDNA